MTAYHRMATLREPWSAWSKPLLTVFAAFASYVIMASALLVTVVLLLALVPGVNVALGVTSGDPASPLDVGLALAMTASAAGVERTLRRWAWPRWPGPSHRWRRALTRPVRRPVPCSHWYWSPACSRPCRWRAWN